MISIDIKQQADLTLEQINILKKLWLECETDILNCTTLAECGHPGGSMSSLNFMLVLYAVSNIRPKNIFDENRDRIIFSHGHISPGVYSVLSKFGFFDSTEMVLNFRRLGSKFAGHVETTVPGVEWNTGNLGQGISAGVGFALSGKTKGLSYNTFVCMGDGEQAKGQIGEARRTASKYNLNNFFVIVDANNYQIGGSIKDVMPQNIEDSFSADGWNVIHIDNGHDFNCIYKNLRKAILHEVLNPLYPTVIIANTKMGYGVSFMCDKEDFHGKACNKEEHAKALNELGVKNNLSELILKRKSLPLICPNEKHVTKNVSIDTGEPILYASDKFTDNRSAYGAALAHLAKLNNLSDSKNKIVGISCDLEGSVKMNDFRKTDPKHFFECGIQEHHAAVMAGSLSKEGFQVFFSTFGIFGVDEVYNQQRLNAFNNTNVKTVCTHLGLSVGEDGPTHQCIDYIGLLRNIPHYSVFLPADPNQTDRIIRYVASCYGNFFVGMGRAKTAVITNDAGEPFFGKDYKFIPGKADIVHKGTDATIIAIGPMLDYALKAAKKLLLEDKISVRVINMASVIPVDKESILKASKETGCILTIEDHLAETGLGSIVDTVLISSRVLVPVTHLGVHDFVGSGIPDELYSCQGMGLSDIEKSIKNLIAQK